MPREQNSPSASPTYRIGAIARWSGIPAETLRIWERRYQVVTPQRSPGGDRLYSAEDLTRLTLIKQLVDNGDSISHLAGLSREALEQRLQAASPALTLPEDMTLSAIVVGANLGNLLQTTRTPLPRLELRAVYDSLAEFETAWNGEKADLLVLEVPTLHDDSARHFIDLSHRVQAGHTLLVYRYTGIYALSRIPLTNFSTMRGPIDLNDFRRRYEEILGQAAHAAAVSAFPDLPTGAPPRIYDNRQLATLMALQSAIQCECPKHLAELITSLTAFERYSAECESRNTEDAMLHAQLCAATGQARYIIEQALQKVVTAEAIAI